jgi:ribosome-associated toxin RatA of RatAB toxin-antitoxin module
MWIDGWDAMKLLSSLGGLGLLFLSGSAAWAAEPASTLEVRSEPSGGVRATATLLLPVPPQVVQQVLSDYERWPDLFGVTMRLARLERHAAGAVTDLYIKHPFLPSERRLLCENRELPGGGLVTTLIAGDFHRYARTWQVTAGGDQGTTRAALDLLVEVDTWAPDWLVALELRRQLLTHFRILREKVLAKAEGRSALH